MNIFKKIAFVNNANKAWKEAKKLIDSNKGTAEEARQIYVEFKALADRAIKLFPSMTNTINGLIEILKKAFG